MTVAEAIVWAERWQDEHEDSHDPAELVRAANAFSFALILLNIERQNALDLLAAHGFDQGPLSMRLVTALVPIRGQS